MKRRRGSAVPEALESRFDREAMRPPRTRPSPMAAGPDRLLDTPLLMARGDETLERLEALAFDLRADPLTIPALGSLLQFGGPWGPSSRVQDTIAVVRVSGTLWRSMWWDDYQDLQEQIDAAAANPAVSGILLDIESPGGRAAGCFELARHIGAVNAEQKRVWAMVNEYACSAAYALASASERVFITRAGQTGSIGAICVHVDATEYDRQLGIKVTEIVSGEHKADLSPHKPLGAGGRNRLERIVAEVSAEFFEVVAAGRPGLTIDQIRAQNAQTYIGADAVEAGLADEVSTFEEVLERMRALPATTGSTANRALGSGGQAMSGGAGTGAPGAQSTQTQAGAAAPGAAPAAAVDPAAGAQPQPAAPAAAVVPAPAAAPVVPAAPAVIDPLQAERARSQQIVNACALGGHPELAGNFIAQGLGVDVVQQRLLAMRAGADASAGEINGAVPPSAQGMGAGAGAGVLTPNIGQVYERWNDPKALRRQAAKTH